MGAKKTQSLNVRVTEEEYGWIMRYADKTDQSMADVVRKAIRLYITAVAKKQPQKNKE